LHERGYTILGRNVRTAYGEIDLIAMLGGTDPEEGSLAINEQPAVLVFVEVKTRSTLAYGQPEESITARKKAHLLAAIQAYMQAHSDLPSDWRVDVIAVWRRQDAEAPEIVHFENAFY
jgi:putative endonuclease